MLAVRARPPFVAAAIALAAGLASFAVEHDASQQTWARPGATTIHARLRVAPHRSIVQGIEVPASVAAAVGDAMIEPLFTYATDDERGRWIRVFNADPRALSRLASDPAVELAFAAPVLSLPVERAPIDARTSCPVSTPSFESYQGYLGPAPHGIDAPAAWRRGYRGAGVWFADIEGGWNEAHEDLPGDRMVHVGGENIREPAWRAHGTAVLGEVVGKDNGKGVVGIAPDVERVVTSSIARSSVADAIDVAARQLRPGDVLLIELQGGGPRGRWIPVEYWDDVYVAIRAATDRGVVVIEAAGNGAEDLDRSVYGRKFDRTNRDSGAIVVGAGGPNRDGFSDREKLDFSNYGSRVDVQGWGRMVATLDYGDLQRCSADGARHYTGEFSGTSSASPIVAGAAIIAQEVARSRGRTLAPRELREVLRSTGTPQAGDTRAHIGPRPDLAGVIRSLAPEAR